MMKEKRITTIENVILRHSNRGMETLRSHLPAHFCRQAADHLLGCNRGAVFIVTGFYVNGTAETDGPPGAYFLARALQTLNYEPIVITDRYCKDYFKRVPPIETIELPIAKKPADDQYDHLLNQYRPVCLIAVERCGRATDGRYYNMRGNDITPFTAPLDRFFLLADEVVTIGVGDGGNEIGMGKFARVIESNLCIIPSVVETDFTIIATTSNWGAYGLIASLETITDISLLPDIEMVCNFLQSIVAMGAVDGVKEIPSLSVDGFDIHREREIVNSLKSICIANSRHKGIQ
ncbi:MAG: DUF4392 domain-containing protein [Candidatus Omnitrophota bacterium]|jgi:hypothetical protein|nr:MAG: DUF4392 domain-containing protein [Candidatus Omnitrophota bacterium]